MTQKKQGFTLIELLVVIAIIGILSAIIIANVGGANSKGRDARRAADLKQLQLALQLYYDANNYYPLGNNSVALTLNAPLTGGNSNYISVLPTDPQAGGSYGYVALPSGCNDAATTCTSYVLAAQFENANTSLNGWTGNQDVTVNGGTANCGTTANLYCVKP